MAEPGKTVVVQLDKSRGSQFGMHVHAQHLTVCSIDAGGLAAAWNRQNPMWAISIGDRILSVNGVRSQEVILEQLASEMVPPGVLEAVFEFWEARGMPKLKIASKVLFKAETPQTLSPKRGIHALQSFHLLSMFLVDLLRKGI